MKTTFCTQGTMVLLLTTLMAGATQAQESSVIQKTAPVEKLVTTNATSSFNYSEKAVSKSAPSKNLGESLKNSGNINVRTQKSSTPMGGMSSSGGHGAEECDGELLDTCENKGTKKLRPLEVGRVASLLEGLKTQLPTFHAAITASLQKNWYLEPKKMDQCKGGESMLKIGLITAACQNNVDVRVNENWYLTTGKTPEARTRNQEATIIHEMVRSLYLAEGEPDPEMEAGLRNIVRHILDQSPVSVLQQQIHASGFGAFNSVVDLQNYRLSVQNLKQLRQRILTADTPVTDQEIEEQVAATKASLKNRIKIASMGWADSAWCLENEYMSITKDLIFLRDHPRYSSSTDLKVLDLCEASLKDAVYGKKP